MKIFEPLPVAQYLSDLGGHVAGVLTYRGYGGALARTAMQDELMLHDPNWPQMPAGVVNLYAGLPDPVAAGPAVAAGAVQIKSGSDNWLALAAGEVLTLSADVVCDALTRSRGGMAQLVLYCENSAGVRTVQSVAQTQAAEPERLAVTLTLPAAASMHVVGVAVEHVGLAAGVRGTVGAQNVVVVRGAVAPSVFNAGAGMMDWRSAGFRNRVLNNDAETAARWLFGGADGNVSRMVDPVFGEFYRITKTSGAAGEPNRVGIQWLVEAMADVSSFLASIWIRRPVNTVAGMAISAEMNTSAFGLLSAGKLLSDVPPGVWTRVYAQSPVEAPVVQLTGGFMYSWVAGPVGSFIDVCVPNLVGNFSGEHPAAVTGGTSWQVQPSSFSGAAELANRTWSDGQTQLALLMCNAESSAPAWEYGESYVAGDRVEVWSRVYERTAVAYANPDQVYVYPESLPDLWLAVGMSNRLAAYDGEVSTRAYLGADGQTPGTLHFHGSLEGANALLISDVSGARRLHVQVRDGFRGPVVVDFTVDATTGAKVRSQYLVDGLVCPAGGVFEVAITGDVSPGLGLIVWGHTEELGASMYGARAGVVDFSRKEPDEFGGVQFVRRPFSKTVDASVVVAKAELNRVQDRLYGLRAQPVVWIFSDDPAHAVPLVVYGFYGDFYTVLDRPLNSVCTLQVKGLT